MCIRIYVTEIGVLEMKREPYVEELEAENENEEEWNKRLEAPGKELRFILSHRFSLWLLPACFCLRHESSNVLLFALL